VAPDEYLNKTYAIGGCDLSATTDLTCATLLIKRPKDPKFYVLQQYFLPKSRVEQIETQGRKEAPYRLWAKQGHLTLCDTATVDYNAVTEWFVKMVQERDIRPLWVCYDAALSGYWVPQMTDYGFDMERIRQGPVTWTYPMKRMKGLFEDGLIVYQNNPMLRWCLSNTAAKASNQRGIDSVQPEKITANRRIDGMVLAHQRRHSEVGLHQRTVAGILRKRDRADLDPDGPGLHKCLLHAARAGRGKQDYLHFLRPDQRLHLREGAADKRHPGNRPDDHQRAARAVRSAAC